MDLMIPITYKNYNVCVYVCVQTDIHVLVVTDHGSLPSVELERCGNGLPFGV